MYLPVTSLSIKVPRVSTFVQSISLDNDSLSPTLLCIAFLVTNANKFSNEKQGG